MIMEKQPVFAIKNKYAERRSAKCKVQSAKFPLSS